jgi:hypothetical protein
MKTAMMIRIGKLAIRSWAQMLCCFAVNDQPVDRDLLDQVALHLTDEFGVRDLRRLGFDAEVLEDRQQHCRNDQPKQQVFSYIVQLLNLARERAVRAWSLLHKTLYPPPNRRPCSFGRLMSRDA